MTNGSPVAVAGVERDYVRRHLRFGWGVLLLFLGLGIVIHPNGSPRQEDFIRLVGVRDDRPIYWIE